MNKKFLKYISFLLFFIIIVGLLYFIKIQIISETVLIWLIGIVGIEYIFYKK